MDDNFSDNGKSIIPYSTGDCSDKPFLYFIKKARHSEIIDGTIVLNGRLLGWDGIQQAIKEKLRYFWTSRLGVYDMSRIKLLGYLIANAANQKKIKTAKTNWEYGR